MGWPVPVALIPWQLRCRGLLKACDALASIPSAPLRFSQATLVLAAALQILPNPSNCSNALGSSLFSLLRSFVPGALLWAGYCHSFPHVDLGETLTGILTHYEEYSTSLAKGVSMDLLLSSFLFPVFTSFGFSSSTLTALRSHLVRTGSLGLILIYLPCSLVCCSTTGHTITAQAKIYS